MSDLYGRNEPEDNMSSFLQILLQNSSSSAANHESKNTSAPNGLFTSAVRVAESSTSINFSDPGGLFTGECEGINPSSSGVKYFLGSNSEGSHDACEVVPPPNPAPPRSSKRSRAAEVHNLSEKRRRSRINEKLKALQTLIPNSNKTDKASMLDEAIEYLKQLQLQVQMLTVRNGLSLHPGYSLGSLQSMLTSSSGVELDEGNVRSNPNRVAETLLRDYNPAYIQNAPETNIGISSTLPPNFISPSIANGSDSEPIPGFMHFGFLNHLNTSKDVCRDNEVSRLQLDISCSGHGNNSSPGVSSSS